VEGRITQLAGADWTSAVVLADSAMAGLAEEGALAFKEICRTQSSFHHVLDVRHGPTVMIDDRTLVLAFVSRGDGGLQADLLSDLAARTDELIAFTCGEPLGVPSVAEIALPPLRHDETGAVFMLYCIQLLCLKRALLRGLDPDQPDGLAAWIELKAS
jgi:glucosamine--fructose-6-phosphate aminotransferase (isomerizing)